MMSNKNKLIILLFVLAWLLIPGKANASSVSVSLSCPTSANAQATITCKVNVTSDVKVNGLSANYSFSSSNFTYSSFTASSGFSVYSSSPSGFSVGNNSGKSGTFTIGTITLKLLSKGTFTINNIDVSDTSYNSYSPSSASATIRTNSTNNSLASLSLSTGTLSPSFSASTTSYTATVDASSVTISATKGESNQTISGTGKKSLSYGTNTFSIVVTSESGSKKTYKIVITRPDNRSSDNYLKSLSLSSGSISFNKSTTTYNVTVDSDVSSLKITATLNDSSASFVSGYGSRTVDLDYGKNVIYVKVKAENTSVRTYTLNVTRTDDRSTDNTLSSLTVSSGTLNFDTNTTEYSITVANTVESIDVSATTTDSKATYKVSNTTLSVGNNTVTVVVTSESGSTKTYTINVRRLSEDETLSDTNTVNSLKILGQDIDFDSDTHEYNLTIKDEYALVFEVVLDDEKSSYDISGNEDLQDGSVITLTITSESGLTNEYEFNISKEKEDNIKEKVTYTIIGFVSGVIVVIGVSLIVISIKRRSSNKK